MKTAAVIAEYNPFHNGHAYQLKKIRDMGFTHVLVVMSGNFVQRGTPAVADMFSRARTAVANGADLVAVLPYPWSCASAEQFAYGGVSLIGSLGAADALCFGTEDTDTDEIRAAARILSSEEFEEKLRCFINTGISFPSAREKAFAYFCCADILRRPNCVLGIEYLLAAEKTGFGGELIAIPRTDTAHDSDEVSGIYASAGKIRAMLAEGVDVSRYCSVPRNVPLVLSDATYERQMICALRRLGREDFGKYTENADLADRLYKAVRKGTSLEEIYSLAKTKCFTHASVRRAAANAFLGIPYTYAKERPPYFRVLAMNGRGREILGAAKPSVPVITKHAQSGALGGFARTVYENELVCSDIYKTMAGTIGPCGTDMTEKIILP